MPSTASVVPLGVRARRVQPRQARGSDARDSGSKQMCSRVRGCASPVVGAWRWLLKKWHHVQIGHRGAYSMERSRDLRDYCQRSNIAKVLCLCIVTPLPPILLMMLEELAPLDNPARGWRANYGCFIRFFMSSFAIALGCVYQIKTMVPELALSGVKLVVISLETAGGHILIVVLMAALWVFPVPFSSVVTVVPFFIIIVTLIIAFSDSRALRELPDVRDKLLRQLFIVFAQSGIVLVYPGYIAIFVNLSSIGQGAFVLLLPLLKLSLKNVVAWASSDNIEAMPEVTVFSIELAHAMYVATSMQTASSMYTSIVIISMDVFHMFISFRSIRRRTDIIQNLQRRYNRGDPTRPLLDSILDFSQDDDVKYYHKISSTSLDLGSSSARRASMTARVTVAPPSFNLLGSTSQLTLNRVSSAPVVPMIPILPSMRTPRRSLVRQSPNRFVQAGSSRLLSEDTTRKVQFLTEAQRLLFHCEYLLLVEYVECAIPLLYALYLSILFYLPSAKYYPYTKSMTLEKLQSTVFNLIAYGWLEVASLVGLHVLLLQRFRLPALRQLGFVLERQQWQMQGHMFVWVIFTLSFMLEHYGVDFSFKFAWMSAAASD